MTTLLSKPLTAQLPVVPLPTSIPERLVHEASLAWQLRTLELADQGRVDGVVGDLREWTWVLLIAAAVALLATVAPEFLVPIQFGVAFTVLVTIGAIRRIIRRL